MTNEDKARGSLDSPVKCVPGKHLHRGAAAVLGVFLMVTLATLMAITIDLGYIHVAETELRRSADAAAMAGCWEIFAQRAESAELGNNLPLLVADAANHVAANNHVGEITPLVTQADVELGKYDPVTGWSLANVSEAQAVRITLRRDNGTNSELPLFYAALTGRESQELKTTAIAAMFSSVAGFFEPPTVHETRGILPLALDLESWEAAVAGSTVDDYMMENGEVVVGSDGIFETNLYPKDTGAPGNRGTVDIGDSNNSTNDLARQILHGISRQDFVDLGKPLVFDEHGELHLNGDTGISAGIKDELASLIGKTRIVPIFTEVSGQGNNSVFTIVKFEGVRILDVKLTGKKSQKRVIVQPATVVGRGIKVDWSGQNHSSHLLTPVMLVE